MPRHPPCALKNLTTKIKKHIEKTRPEHDVRNQIYLRNCFFLRCSRPLCSSQPTTPTHPHPPHNREKHGMRRKTRNNQTPTHPGHHTPRPDTPPEPATHTTVRTTTPGTSPPKDTTPTTDKSPVISGPNSVPNDHPTTPTNNTFQKPRTPNRRTRTPNPLTGEEDTHPGTRTRTTYSHAGRHHQAPIH